MKKQPITWEHVPKDFDTKKFKQKI
jgi:hypothetical protein